MAINDAKLYYSFDDSDLATDLSGNGNDGTNNGATTGVSGVLNQEFSFNGSSNYVDSNYQPTGLSAFTVNLWFNIAGASSGTDVLFGSSATNARIYVAVASSNRIQFSTINSSGSTSTINSATNIFTPTNNVMVTAVWNGSTCELFVNNVSVGSGSLSGSVNILHDFAIGAYNNNGSIGNHFGGTIDEPSFYDYAFDSTDRAEIWNSGAGYNPYGTPPTLTTGLLAFWNFNGDSTDASGNGANGSDSIITYPSGKINESASATGASTSEINVANQPNINNKDFTIGLWVFPNSSQARASPKIMAQLSSAAGGDWLLMYNTGDKLYWRTWSGSQLETAAGTFLSNVWSYIVITHNFTTKAHKMYINNVERFSGTTVSPNSSTDLKFFDWGFNTQNFAGKLDACGMWDRILTTEERTSLYNGGTGLEYPFTTSGYPNKVNGVTPSKINGVEVANISKFNGI